MNVRNRLYHEIGPHETRRVLATIFPNGTVTTYLEQQLAKLKEQGGLIDTQVRGGVIDELIEQLLAEYAKDPKFKYLSQQKIK